jgi:predicted permease
MIDNVFLSLIPIVALGWVLRHVWVDAENIRQAINKLVINLLLPALVFKSIMSYPIDRSFIAIPIVSFVTIFSSVIISLIVVHFFRIPNRTKGAFVLAAGFGNVTFLGLPLLQGVFPEAMLQVAKDAILYEVTQSILTLTFGVLLAIYFGSNERLSPWQVLKESLKLPPLVVLLVAVGWRLLGLPDPTVLITASSILSMGIAGLMLMSLGIALNFRRSSLMLLAIPVVLIKLAFGPVLMTQLLPVVGLNGLDAQALTLEAAMPTGLISLVIASRYKLDERNLVFFILVDTLVSVASLPLVHRFL